MAKIKKTIKGKIPEPAPPQQSITPQGKKLAWAGGISVVLGFAVLSRADSLGRNWAATLSPFLILAGYAAIGVGLFLPPPPTPPSTPP